MKYRMTPLQKLVCNLYIMEELSDEDMAKIYDSLKPVKSLEDVFVMDFDQEHGMSVIQLFRRGEELFLYAHNALKEIVVNWYKRDEDGKWTLTQKSCGLLVITQINLWKAIGMI